MPPRVAARYGTASSRNVPGDRGLRVLVPRGSSEPALRSGGVRSLLDGLGCEGKDASLSLSARGMSGVTLGGG